MKNIPLEILQVLPATGYCISEIAFQNLSVLPSLANGFHGHE